MSPSIAFGSGISRYRAVVALAFAVVVSLFVASVPLPPLAVVLAVVTVLYLGASAFDAVRSHPAFNLVSAAYGVLLFGLWYLISDAAGVVLLVFTALAAAGFVVEAYNYRHGTSYLRFDF
ncbi:phosphatidate cytidylyltransferase [Halopelagius fulvigenes]|uniref:Phosphatidate cytidylyltransferase n=1 Tax=Halopelagius fulvigenes TaxID=1198324 RepID=A0ABD5U424_9EURY